MLLCKCGNFVQKDITIKKYKTKLDGILVHLWICWTRCMGIMAYYIFNTGDIEEEDVDSRSYKFKTVIKLVFVSLMAGVLHNKNV